MPWWLKIPLKIVLSRLPIDYRRFARLGLFRHGRMLDLDYARDVVSSHQARSDLPDLVDLTVLELGPGDSLLGGFIAAAQGARCSYLVDAGAFAERALEAYAPALDALGLAWDADSSLDTVIANHGIQYLPNGLDALKAIPEGSVDFIWSQAVLEHVRLHEFDETLAELRRVLKSGGIASHRVDLKDHLDASLNNLRFAAKIWENPVMANSGFYTNRIRFSDMVERFERAGFSIELESVDRFDPLPIAPSRLAEPFRRLSGDELAVSGFSVVTR